MKGDQQTGPCDPPGPSCATAGLGALLGPVLGYAVLLLEHGVLCVLPMLCAALLFSEAGCDFWTCCVPAVSPRQKAGEGRRRGKTDINDRQADVGKNTTNRFG